MSIENGKWIENGEISPFEQAKSFGRNLSVIDTQKLVSLFQNSLS